MTDLRSFLEHLKVARPSDLLQVHREVDPRFETAAIVAKLEERHRSPAILFHRVKGSPWPMVTNVCGSQGRLALALGCGLKELASRWAQAVERPVPPVVVEEAPVQTHVFTGDDVDLGILPQLSYHQDDTPAPYLTAAIVAARDPETHKVNLSYHRLMVLDPRRTAIYMEPGKHLDRIFQRYRARGEAMPVAVILGAHPAWSLGTLYSGSAEVEEWDVIGGLMQAPLELARARTQPGVLVPARAELVLEGVVHPELRVEEGPFGEFTGYGTGVTQSPVFEVTALTHREAPIFQDIVSGHMEHLVLPMLAIEHRTLRDAKVASSGVVGVALGAPLTAVVGLEKTSDEEPLRIIRALLEGDIYTKQVIVVDAAVDYRDFRQVLGAFALHVQADRDVHVFPNMQGTPLDPSCPSADGKVAKLGIDATRKLAPPRSLSVNRIPAEVLAKIDLAELLGGKGG